MLLWIFELNCALEFGVLAIRPDWASVEQVSVPPLQLYLHIKITLSMIMSWWWFSEASLETWDVQAVRSQDGERGCSWQGAMGSSQHQRLAQSTSVCDLGTLRLCTKPVPNDRWAISKLSNNNHTHGKFLCSGVIWGNFSFWQCLGLL